MILWRTVNPSALDATFMDAVDRHLWASPYDWVVTHGFRSLATQADLYAKWKAHLAGGLFAGKAAPPGKSAHNFGFAIDIVLDVDPQRPGLQPSWDLKLKGWLWLASSLVGHPILKHGAAFGDSAHIERRDWKRILRERGVTA